MTRRMPKVDDLIQAEVAELLQRQVKHPDLQDVMLSITRVETSPDLQSARVFVSVMDDSLDPRTIQAALEHTEPFIHRELGRRLHMRRIPRIRFILDRSIAEGDRIAALLRGVEYSSEPEDEAYLEGAP
jgi:ribosome-binding factor A